MSWVNGCDSGGFDSGGSTRASLCSKLGVSVDGFGRLAALSNRPAIDDIGRLLARCEVLGMPMNAKSKKKNNLI